MKGNPGGTGNRMGKPMNQISQADLAKQREDFALDGAEDRPYHFLATARAKRGQPWNLNLERGPRMAQTIADFGFGLRRSPDENRAAFRRMYPAALPLERHFSAFHEDGQKWAAALRRGA